MGRNSVARAGCRPVVYVLTGGADFGAGHLEPARAGPRRDEQRAAVRACDRPDLGSEPRLADLRDRGDVLGLPTRVCGARNRAAHPDRTLTGRHRAARSRVFFPRLRPGGRAGARTLDAHLRLVEQPDTAVSRARGRRRLDRPDPSRRRPGDERLVCGLDDTVCAVGFVVHARTLRDVIGRLPRGRNQRMRSATISDAER